jgi:hypothetical protein
MNPARRIQPEPQGPSLQSFEAGTFDAATLSHRAHVYVAWCYLQQYDLSEAIRRFTAALRRFTKSIGQVHKYHETISWFFMILVAERRLGPAADDWFLFEQQNPDLLQRGGQLLRRYYSQAVLDSDRAKLQFVLPDFPGR